MKKKVVLNSLEFEYSLTRKNVKNINLRVKPDGTLHVSANYFVSIKRIDSFLISNSDKIIKALDKFSKKAAIKECRFEDGETLYILGEPKALTLSESKKNLAVIKGNELFIFVKDKNNFELKQRIFERFKKEVSETVISRICDSFYPLFEAKGIKYPELKFRKMKRRWGSCQPKKGVLTFNTKLAEMPMTFIEYVVMHEFVHFLHPDHSKAFYETLTRLMPDWENRLIK